jgi:hypothetical protein
MPFSTISQETIYRGHAFNLRRDELKTPDQRTIHLEIIEHVGAVTLLPMDADGRMLPAKSCLNYRRVL